MIRQSDSTCTRGGETLLPVFAALETAQVLRHDADNAAVSGTAEVTRLRHEAAMLRHWLQVSEEDCAEYSALLEGLGAFADRIERRLAAWE